MTHTTRSLWIVEPGWSGHHLFYVRLLAEGAIGVGLHPRWVTSHIAAGSDEARIHLQDLVESGSLTLTTVGAEDHNPAGGVTRSVLKWVRRTAAKSDIIVIPEADKVLLPWLSLAYLSRRRTSLLLMRSSGATPKERFLTMVKGALSFALKALGQGRAFRLVHPFAHAEDSASLGISWLPMVRDPLPHSRFPRQSDAKKELGLAVDSKVALVAGGLHERKCLKEIVSWAADPYTDCKLTILFAGSATPHSADVKSSPECTRLDQSDRIVWREGYLSDEELRTCYAAASVVLCLYRNPGPSGALAYAAASRTPIIAWGSKEVVSAVRQHDLGVVTEGLGPHQLRNALAAVDSPGETPEPVCEGANTHLSTLFTDLIQFPQACTPAPETRNTGTLGRWPR